MLEISTKVCRDEFKYASRIYSSLSENDKRLINALMDTAFVLLRNIQICGTKNSNNETVMKGAEHQCHDITRSKS